jgi:hypothetical protein
VKRALSYLDKDMSSSIEFEEFLRFTDFAWKCIVTSSAGQNRQNSMKGIGQAKVKEKVILPEKKAKSLITLREDSGFREDVEEKEMTSKVRDKLATFMSIVSLFFTYKLSKLLF